MDKKVALLLARLLLSDSVGRRLTESAKKRSNFIRIRSTRSKSDWSPEEGLEFSAFCSEDRCSTSIENEPI